MKCATVALAGAILMASSPSGAVAQQAPRAGCVPVAKQEYTNARKSRLQRQRFGEYIRTGRVLKRFYWFCPQ